MDVYTLLAVSNLACVTSPDMDLERVLKECGRPDTEEVVNSKLYGGRFIRFVYVHDSYEEAIFFYADGRIRQVEIRKLNAAPSE